MIPLPDKRHRDGSRVPWLPGYVPRFVDAVTLGDSTPFGAGSIPLLHEDGPIAADGVGRVVASA